MPFPTSISAADAFKVVTNYALSFVTTKFSWVQAIICFATIVYYFHAFCPLTVFRFRHIKGPWGLPFLGNLIPYTSKGNDVYFLELEKKYGKVFKIWFGSTPWIVIGDAELFRSVAFKFMDHIDLPVMARGAEKHMMDYGLFVCSASKGPWKHLRKAWDPLLLNQESLAGYAPIMHASVSTLIEHLKQYAEDPAGVDMHTEVGTATLETVGSCGFGVHLNAHAKPGESNGQDIQGADVLEGIKGFFRASDPERMTKWLMPAMAVPSLAPVWAWLSYTFPDAGQKEFIWSMRAIRAESLKIIAACRGKRKMEEAKAAAAASLGAKPTDSPTAAAPPQKKGLTGVVPGSFIQLFESWRTKNPNALLDDNMLATQMFVFLGSGQETTTAGISLFIHNISSHPDVEAKLLQELDSVLGGKPPSVSDLQDKLPYLKACIDEGLRLFPPVTITWRANHLGHDVDVKGLRVPKDAKFALNIYSLHHNPDYWTEPSKFMPERFLPETEGRLGPFHEHAYMPFGTGARQCVGYKFAKLKVAMTVAMLYQHFTFTRHPAAPKFATKVGFTVSPKGGLPMRVHLRKP